MGTGRKFRTPGTGGFAVALASPMHQGQCRTAVANYCPAATSRVTVRHGRRSPACTDFRHSDTPGFVTRVLLKTSPPCTQPQHPSITSRPPRIASARPALRSVRQRHFDSGAGQRQASAIQAFLTALRSPAQACPVRPEPAPPRMLHQHPDASRPPRSASFPYRSPTARSVFVPSVNFCSIPPAFLRVQRLGL